MFSGLYVLGKNFCYKEPLQAGKRHTEESQEEASQYNCDGRGKVLGDFEAKKFE